MSDAGLLLAAAAFLLTGAAALWAARRCLQERSPEEPLELELFAAWWIGLGLATLSRGCESLLAALGVRDVSVFWALRVVSIAATSAALGMLGAHAALLLTGSRKALLPIALASFVLASAALGVTVRDAEPGVWVGEWGAGVMDETARPYVLFLALFAVPAMAVSSAYLALRGSAMDAAHRRRLQMGGAAVVVGFGGLLAAQIVQDWSAALHGAVKIGGLLTASMAVVVGFRRSR